MKDPYAWVELFTALSPDRQCGSCTACCTHTLVDEPDFKKAEGVTCQHCTGNGCGIFTSPERPLVCRTWYCLWRRLGLLPEEAFPPRSDVMLFVSFNPNASSLFFKLCISVTALESSLSLSEPGLVPILYELADRYAVPILLKHKQVARLIYPDPALADAVLQPEKTPFVALRAEAAAWHENYTRMLAIMARVAAR